MFLAMAIVPCIPAIAIYLKQAAMAKIQKSNSDLLKKNTEDTEQAKLKIEDVHVRVNGRLEELINAKVSAALAQGKAAGIKEENARATVEAANQAIGKLEGNKETIQ